MHIIMHNLCKIGFNWNFWNKLVLFVSSDSCHWKIDVVRTTEYCFKCRWQVNIFKLKKKKNQIQIFMVIFGFSLQCSAWFLFSDSSTLPQLPKKHLICHCHNREHIIPTNHTPEKVYKARLDWIYYFELFFLTPSQCQKVFKFSFLKSYHFLQHSILN